MVLLAELSAFMPYELVLKPEPTNEFDKNAVAVFDQKGRQLGYLPKDLAAGLASGFAEQAVITARLVAVDGPNKRGNLYGRIEVTAEFTDADAA
jgi:hypothetical protein